MMSGWRTLSAQDTVLGLRLAGGLEGLGECVALDPALIRQGRAFLVDERLEPSTFEATAKRGAGDEVKEKLLVDTMVAGKFR